MSLATIRSFLPCALRLYLIVRKDRSSAFSVPPVVGSRFPGHFACGPEGGETARQALRHAAAQTRVGAGFEALCAPLSIWNLHARRW